MYVDITVKMLVGALGVFAILRIIGKKAISELTPFDLIYGKLFVTTKEDITNGEDKLGE